MPRIRTTLIAGAGLMTMALPADVAAQVIDLAPTALRADRADSAAQPARAWTGAGWKRAAAGQSESRSATPVPIRITATGDDLPADVHRGDDRQGITSWTGFGGLDLIVDVVVDRALRTARNRDAYYWQDEAGRMWITSATDPPDHWTSYRAFAAAH